MFSSKTLSKVKSNSPSRGEFTDMELLLTSPLLSSLLFDLTVRQCLLRREFSSLLMGRRRRHTRMGSCWRGSSSMNSGIMEAVGAAIICGRCVCVVFGARRPLMLGGGVAGGVWRACVDCLFGCVLLWLACLVHLRRRRLVDRVSALNVEDCPLGENLSV